LIESNCNLDQDCPNVALILPGKEKGLPKSSLVDSSSAFGPPQNDNEEVSPLILHQPLANCRVAV